MQIQLTQLRAHRSRRAIDCLTVQICQPMSGPGLHEHECICHATPPATHFLLLSLMSLVVIVQVKEVGDGNINYVYVLEGPAGSLCVKQGHPYVRIMKSWKLSQVCRS